MSERIPHLSMVISIAVLTLLSACITAQPTIVEKLDEQTAVSVTYTRMPITISPGSPNDELIGRDYVRMGLIEINRMGTLNYYLWLGIDLIDYTNSLQKQPSGFESIVLIMGGEKLRLDARGWTHEAIGTSKPIYKKLFATSVDAYYQITLDQIRLLTEADGIQLHTTGPARREFVPSYRQSSTKNELQEFLRTVLQ